jgi:hypothetical protein
MLRKLLNRKTFAVFVVLLALAARFVPGPRTIDDAYITFRYARNLLAGSGFVFNPGEATLGTTTPLYTLLMAGLGALSGGPQAPFPWLALGVNALADAATCLLLWRLARRMGAERAGLVVALLWAVAPFSVTFAIGGLETSLYVFLLCALVVTHMEHRRRLAALLAALALLTRPDALLMVAPLMLDRFVRQSPFLARRLPFLFPRREQPEERPAPVELLAFFLPLFFWLLFSTLYFGSPIPHSVQAKMAAYQLPSWAALVRLMQHYATPFLLQNLTGSISVYVGLVAFPFLNLVGLRRSLRLQPASLAWVIFPWVYFAAFAIANPLIFRWYLTPPLPFYFLVIILGAGELLEFLQPHLPRVLGALILTLPMALPVVGTLSEWQIHPDHGSDRPAPHMAFIKLELLYEETARLLAPHVDQNTTLAAGDVGVLGYELPCRILDTVGLVSQQSIPYYPLPDDAYVINYAMSADLILDEQPDWVVLLEAYGRRTLLQDERFLQQYTLWRTLPTDMYGSEGLLIYQHN